MICKTCVQHYASPRNGISDENRRKMQNRENICNICSKQRNICRKSGEYMQYMQQTGKYMQEIGRIYAIYAEISEEYMQYLQKYMHNICTIYAKIYAKIYAIYAELPILHIYAIYAFPRLLMLKSARAPPAGGIAPPSFGRYVTVLCAAADRLNCVHPRGPLNKSLKSSTVTIDRHVIWTGPCTSRSEMQPANSDRG